MHSTKNAPLDALLAELDVDSERAPASGGHQQKQRRAYRSSSEGFHSTDEKAFRSHKLATSTRVVRTIAFFLFAVLVGVAATLVVFPPVAWLAPVSETKTPIPSLTAADLQEQLKPLAVDLALMRRSMEQLGSNLDQLARRQDQLAKEMATLQAAEQQVSQTGSTPPPPKAVSAAPAPHKPVHVPLPAPKSLQPSVQ